MKKKSRKKRRRKTIKARSIAVFEEINSDLYPKVKELMQKGFMVYYLNDKVGVGPRSEKIIPLSEVGFDYVYFLNALKSACADSDEIFEKHYSNNKSIKIVAGLFEFPGLVDLYKKRFLFYIELSYEMIFWANDIAKRNPDSKIHFYPLNYEVCRKSGRLDEGVKLCSVSTYKTRVKGWLLKIGYLGYAPFLLFKKIGGITREKKKEEFKVGLGIRHPDIFMLNYYSENILIDEKEFPKEDVLFIDESGGTNVEDYKKRGYNYTLLKDDRESFSRDLFYNKLIKKFFPAWVRIAFSITEDPATFFTSCRIMADYVLWNVFTDGYKIKNYVRRLLPDDVSRLRILKENGAKTWWYFPDNYCVDYHTDWKEGGRIVPVLTFIDYDYVVVYGDKLKRFLQGHRNPVGEYIKNGVLFSQIIREIPSGKLKSNITQYLTGKAKKDTKFVGVFDTTFSLTSPYGVEDGIKFWNDMFRLLEEREDFYMILKPKQKLVVTPKLLPIFEKFKNHERCTFFSLCGGTGISASEVIAQSDLVITLAFTSTTAEALAAGKRAVYYDIEGKYRLGNNGYWDKFPNLVAHDYKALKRLMNYWFKVSDKGLNTYLRKYVKGEIDPYLDGKALSRLRRMLMK